MKTEIVRADTQLGKEDYEEITQGVYIRSDGTILVLGDDGQTALLIHK